MDYWRTEIRNILQAALQAQDSNSQYVTAAEDRIYIESIVTIDSDDTENYPYILIQIPSSYSVKCFCS